MSKKENIQAEVLGDRYVPVEKEPGLVKAAFIALIKGDWGVKLSAVIMGMGYFARRQFVKGLLMTILQVGLIAFIINGCTTYLVDFTTLGTQQWQEPQIDWDTMTQYQPPYDNSFTILLFSVITIIAIILFVVVWLLNLRGVYKLQLLKESGKKVNNFLADIKMYLNEKFHITLLSLPVLGVVVFTVIPLIILIAVAFTNYDPNHQLPKNLLSWVGFENFTKLFEMSQQSSFGYSFKEVLVWTLVWAFFATFSNYFLGIMLAKFLLNKKTRLAGVWRTIFVVTIAVPQFVTLMIVRHFFADAGIANTFLSDAGVVGFLKDLGLVAQHKDFIPFLTDPVWAKITIIVINIWVGVPYQMLIATGVLLNIPADMQESAKIDGATEWQSFWKITMPYMFAVTGPTLVTDFVRNINNFNVIYLLTQDNFITTNQQLSLSQAKEVDLLVTWLFRLTQENNNYKMASVIGIMVFIICAAFTLISFRFLTKGDKEKEFA